MLPWLIEERATRWLVAVLFWPTMAMVAVSAVTAGPMAGWLMAVAPVVLVWRVSRRGLSGVSWFLLGTALAMTLVFPASQLGKAQEQPVGVMLVVLVVWCAAFPAMLKHVDRHFRQRRSTADGYEKAELRLLAVRLSMATVVMLTTDEVVAALACALALLTVRKWTAVLAGLACVVCPLFSVKSGVVVWDASWAEVTAAVLSGHQWLAAVRHPRWRGGLPGGRRVQMPARPEEPAHLAAGTPDKTQPPGLDCNLGQACLCLPIEDSPNVEYTCSTANRYLWDLRLDRERRASLCAGCDLTCAEGCGIPPELEEIFDRVVGREQPRKEGGS